MTTTAHPALARYMAARADVSPRPRADAGTRACAALTESLDAAFRVLAAEASPGIAAVAVGGYGRGEQCRHSDIDVMLLIEPGAEPRAKLLLYPVWDTGVKVGHSIRTLAHVTEAGKQSVETLEHSRLVCAHETDVMVIWDQHRFRATAARQDIRDVLAHYLV